MAEVATGRGGKNLRPEDATTLEEFQARRDAELTRIGAPKAYRREGSMIALTVVVAEIDVVYWYRFSQASGTHRWLALALALLFLCSTIGVASRVKPDVLRGSRRRRGELERLAAQWRDRADRGEVARTTLTTLVPVIDLTRIDGPTAPTGPTGPRVLP